MQKIQILINDIEKFQVESTDQYNREKKINLVEFFNLIEQIDGLASEDFNTSEKFELFLKYWNQDIRKLGRLLLSNSLKENSINLNSFLILSNDFIGLLAFLK